MVKKEAGKRCPLEGWLYRETQNEIWYSKAILDLTWLAMSLYEAQATAVSWAYGSGKTASP